MTVMVSAAAAAWELTLSERSLCARRRYNYDHLHFRTDETEAQQGHKLEQDHSAASGGMGTGSQAAASWTTGLSAASSKAREARHCALLPGIQRHTVQSMLSSTVKTHSGICLHVRSMLWHNYVHWRLNAQVTLQGTVHTEPCTLFLLHSLEDF